MSADFRAEITLDQFNSHTRRKDRTLDSCGDSRPRLSGGAEAPLFVESGSNLTGWFTGNPGELARQDSRGWLSPHGLCCRRKLASVRHRNFHFRLLRELLRLVVSGVYVADHAHAWIGS